MTQTYKTLSLCCGVSVRRNALSMEAYVTCKALQQNTCQCIQNLTILWPVS